MTPKQTRYPLLLLVLIAALAMLLLPAAAVETDGYFYLCAQTRSALIFAPERVYYTEGQTVAQALTASGHTFTGLSDGNVTAIDGTVGNFVRASENGGYDMSIPASSIRFFCFSESESAQPSASRQALIRAMADYACEEADVRTAAKSAYDTALTRFIAASDAEAASCADAITSAIRTYQATLSGTAYAITFASRSNTYTQSAFPGVSVQAENAYGRVYTDTDGDGVLSLPAGAYTYRISLNGLSVSGPITVSQTATAEADLPAGSWLSTDTLALSETYLEEFESGVFESTYDASTHTFTIPVPDTFAGRLYLCADTAQGAPTVSLSVRYQKADGTTVETALAFNSKNSGLDGVLNSGNRGNTVTLLLRRTENERTYEEAYTLQLRRRPTLSALRLTDEKGGALAADVRFHAHTTEYTYPVLNSLGTVTILPQAFGSYADGYRVTVNGTPINEGASAALSLESGTQTTTQVRVSAGGEETVYTLRFQPSSGRTITFNTTAADVTMVVVNQNGEELPFTRYRQTNGYNAYQYTLIPGQTYSYVATKDVYFHASKTFVPDESGSATFTVSVKTDEPVSSLALGGSNSKKGYTLSPAFQTGTHTYTVSIPDTRSSVYAWGVWSGSGKMHALYSSVSSNSTDRSDCSVEILNGKSSGQRLSQILMQNAYDNTLTLRLSQTSSSDGVTYYQDYLIHFTRTLSLENLTLLSSGEALTLQDASMQAVSFQPDTTEYYVSVPAALTELTVRPALFSDASHCRYGDDDSGYTVSVGGKAVSGGADTAVRLNGSTASETVTISVRNRHNAALETVYTIHVLKSAPVYLRAALSPSESLLAVYDQLSGKRLWPENGAYTLSDGFTYSYLLTQSGYVGKSGTIAVSRSGALTLDGTPVTVVTGADGKREASVSVQLTRAQENTALVSVAAQWADFRGTSFAADGTPGAGAYSNNAVVSSKLPVTAGSGTLLWASQLGYGTSGNAVGSPILVDGCLITYAGNTIYKVDPVSGETLLTGQMDHSSSFAITPPSYYEGMIFVALSDGTVQAFDAKTLRSLWIYRDPLGGQSNSPITVYDGYLYTGFWNSETANANYVCLSVTDELPDSQNEEKTPTWRYTQPGGFYWAGAYVSEDYLLVGTDDGQNGYTAQTSSLLMLDRRTGAVLDRCDGLNADIRSSVCYDSATDAFYFTSKGGSFYRVQTKQVDGAWKLTGLQTLRLTGSDGGAVMSTSTPVVYNGRAYIGIGGPQQFEQYSGHGIVVIDLASWRVAYTAPTQGYPQTSGLLTSGYDGYAYVFFFDNFTPGKLRILRDRAGQTQSEYLTVEEGKSCAYAVFTPVGEQAQYAICSPIADEYGTIYFKNDSGYLMAFGSAITKLELTQNPDKLHYSPGETFDPAGMKVTARLQNGLSRDVTDYVRYSTDPLRAEDTQITLRLPYVLYHNQENGSGMSTGVTSVTPYVTLPLQMQPAADAATAITELRTAQGGITVVLNGASQSGWRLVAAAYAADGRMLVSSVALAEGGTTQTLPLRELTKAATVRVFVMDAASGKPVLASASLSLQ